MTTPTNYVRNALLRMDGPTRRAFRNATRDRVNRDPNNTDPMTTAYFAVYCQIVDLDVEETETLRLLDSPGGES